MKLLVMVGALAFAVVAAGCSNGGSCTAKSKCGNDPQPTEDEITLCNNKLNDQTCGSLYSDYLGCVDSNRVCTESATTDLTATPCNDKYEKYQNCYFKLDASAD